MFAAPKPSDAPLLRAPSERGLPKAARAKVEADKALSAKTRRLLGRALFGLGQRYWRAADFTARVDGRRHSVPRMLRVIDESLTLVRQRKPYGCDSVSGDMARHGIVLVALASALGCTSGSGTGDPGALCEGTCQKIVAVGCPNDEQSSCISECQSELGQFASCSGEMGAMVDCYMSKVPLTCGSSGKAIAQTPPGVSSTELMQSLCPTQAGAFSACIACEPQPNDGPTETCLKQSCCSEAKSYFKDPDYPGHASCMDACYDTPTACAQTCTGKHLSAGAKFEAITSCGLSQGC